ncbi:hypothetical protein GCM10017608_07740 [Agromyces luteolus]|uniref:Uncharacterized protein n=1 Tax=Agromyces luteolus TaxID=88373 RepID=A0A7C9HJ37_9MICO|nr:hypothetical protein [Agromyces luteolus]MUN08308.1 hypothetical protein [Agromyces luteolus]GLK26841.1 hypothetical protein GCM10017608_07740 [Agromyces luteolus]
MRTTTLTASALLFAGTALVATIAATPANARPEPAPGPTAVLQTTGPCLLERVGTQFVRCDDLTGAGAPAPSHIPEQS